MQQHDLEQVVAIEENVSEVPWSYQIFSDCLKIGYWCWVLAKEDKVVGFGLLSVGAGEGHILNFGIDPEYHRQGLGKRLLRHLLRQNWHLNADNMILEVRVSNLIAQNLYTSFGFVQIGTRVKYYQTKDGGTEDAMLMELKREARSDLG